LLFLVVLLQDFLIILFFSVTPHLPALDYDRGMRNPESLLFSGILLEFAPGFPLSREWQRGRNDNKQCNQ